VRGTPGEGSGLFLILDRLRLHERKGRAGGDFPVEMKSRHVAPPEPPDSPWMDAMRRGDFEGAWRETDRVELARRAEERAGRYVWQPHHLLWNGEPFAARRVLVRCNHGLGDTLQFARFLPKVRAVARELTVLVQPTLVELMSQDESFGEVRNGWTKDPPPTHDVAVEIMELAYAFRCTAETLPKSVPYLPAHALRERATGLPIPKGRGELRVGLLWAASEWETRRSIPLRLLDALERIEGVRYFSLQQGRPADECGASPLDIQPLSQHTQAVADAAAAMLQLDLIVTVDCMAAHLAGALGRPVWMLLRHEADWRWMQHRADSPWYPTMRIFRQPREGAWEPVVEEVAAALRGRAELRPRV
jgi:hypothetical protein